MVCRSEYQSALLEYKDIRMTGSHGQLHFQYFSVVQCAGQLIVARYLFHCTSSAVLMLHLSRANCELPAEEMVILHFPFPSHAVCCILQFCSYRLWFGFEWGTDSTESSSLVLGWLLFECWLFFSEAVHCSGTLSGHMIFVSNMAIAEGTFFQKRCNRTVLVNNNWQLGWIK